MITASAIDTGPPLAGAGSRSGPTGPASPATLSPAVLAAWQAALRAEHAGVFGYGLLGPRLGAADVALARVCEAAHRARRDTTETAMVAAGVTPSPSDADYPLPFALDSVASAQRLALRLEDAAAAAWRYLIAAAATADGATAGATSALRAGALVGLADSAVRSMRWRERIDPLRPTEPFPGI
ncbi:MAG: ferritin-like domain-containing protein [Actinomycetota bacterium]|nr:ferritin-like domain-containing protein [Actinomycetota bacterium]